MALLCTLIIWFCDLYYIAHSLRWLTNYIWIDDKFEARDETLYIKQEFIILISCRFDCYFKEIARNTCFDK